MKRALLLFLALVLCISAIALFPISEGSSSVFYIACAFFAFSLLVSSSGVGFEKGLAHLGLLPKKGSMPQLFGWGVIAFFACMLVAFAASAALAAIGFLDTDPVRAKILSLPPQIIIVAFTFAPFAEEALFRGVAFRKFKEIIGKKSGMEGRAAVLLAAIFSSAIFASLHFGYGSVAEIAVAFLIGIALCAFTQKTGSLFPAVIAHCLFNLLSVSMTLACASGACPF